MLRTLIRRGLRPWMAVGVAAGLLAVVRRVTAEPPETVWRQALEPGESLLIRVRTPDEPEA